VEGSFLPPGVLDGIPIMRYAHVYRERASGGVEQYLRQLIRVCFNDTTYCVTDAFDEDDAHEGIEVENVGIVVSCGCR